MFNLVRQAVSKSRFAKKATTYNPVDSDALLAVQETVNDEPTILCLVRDDHIKKYEAQETEDLTEGEWTFNES